MKPTSLPTTVASFRFSLLAVASLAVASGCGNEKSPALAPVASEQQAIVGTSSGPFPIVFGGLPALDRQHGRTAQAPITSTGPLAIHGGVFSDGADLAASPQSADPSSVSSAWITDATHDRFAAPAPAFATRLTEALAGAEAHASDLDATTLSNVLSVISDLPGGSGGPGTLTSEFVSYLAERGRWLQGYETFGQPPILYSEPLVMAEARERGARLYCAAREAQNNHHQSAATKSMGKLSAAKFTLFGKEIDLLTVEPTIVLDGPLPYVGLAPGCPALAGCAPGTPPIDGAQAFQVPFLFGTQITPISLLPSLDEIRYPVVLVSGDAEITPISVVFGGGPPVAYAYHTFSHTDGIYVESTSGQASAQFPLAFIGPVEIDLKFGLGMGVGTSAPPGTCPGASQPPLDQRLLQPPKPNTNPPWPTSTRSGFQDPLYGYADGPWLLTGTQLPFSGTIAQPYQVLSAKKGQVPYPMGVLQTFQPTLVRALADDDRHLSTPTELALTADIIASLDLNLGIVDANLSATGSICGTVGLRHSLEAGLTAIAPPPTFAPPPAYPFDVVTVSPSMYAGVNIGFSVTLQLSLDLPFVGNTTIFDATLVNVGATLASFDTLSNPNTDPWSEANRFRLGTGSDFGRPLKQPFADSHFPNNGQFESFPSGNGVDACLANAAQNMPPPPTCKGSTTPATTPPTANVCVYAAQPLFAPVLSNVCSDIAGYVAGQYPGANAAQLKCQIDRYTFLCSAVSKEQLFNVDEDVVAHLLLSTDKAATTAALTQLQSIESECVNANFTADSSPADIKAYAQALFEYGICDSTATLLTSSQVFSGPSNPSQPPTVQQGTCQ